MERDIIEQARSGFGDALMRDDYARIHSDDGQLARLGGLVGGRPGKAYLDIGTGTGYVAFALARAFPEARVTGLDIAANAIASDNERAMQEKISNLEFIAFDGGDFPFADGAFSGAISRFAFHHFPDVDKSISEIARVIDETGFFILSDPLTYEDDSRNFVDEFQGRKKDGHVHFLTREQALSRFAAHGFAVEEEFSTTFRYPRAMDEGYARIFKNAEAGMLEKYKIEFEADKVFITVAVMNIKFRKKAG